MYNLNFPNYRTETMKKACFVVTDLFRWWELLLFILWNLKRNKDKFFPPSQILESPLSISHRNLRMLTPKELFHVLWVSNFCRFIWYTQCFTSSQEKHFLGTATSKAEMEFAEAAGSTNRKEHGKRYLGLGHVPVRTSRT